MKLLRHSTTNDALVVWIETKHHTNTPPRWTWLTVLDRDGVEGFPVDSPVSRLTSINRSNQHAVAAYEVNYFPRRDRTIRLRLQENDKPNERSTVAEFEVRNKWPVTQPMWKEEPLPQKKWDDDKDFTLLALNTGLTATGQMRGMFFNDVTEAVFRIGTNEPARLGTNTPPYGDWIIKSLALSDATGNSLYVREPKARVVQMVGQQFWMRGDDGVANVPGGVWTGETVRLRAEFALTMSATLPDEQVWTVKRMDLPRTGETVTLGTNAHVFGTTVRLLSLAAGSTGKAEPQLRLEFAAPDSRYELRVRTTDLKRTNFFAARDRKSRGSNLIFNLRPHPEATNVDVMLGVTRTYAAEFLVRPTLLRTNLAHWPMPKG